MNTRAALSVRSGRLLPLAVTGGIAEGKSTVMGYLREANINCVSADDVARSVWDDPNTKEALARFVDRSLLKDRSGLLGAMSADATLRRSVNSVLHPLILSRMVSSGAQAVEVPLLIETCLQGLFQSVWVVTCGAIEQEKRLMERLGDDQVVHGMIASQLSSEVKIVFADQIIRTNRPPYDVHSQVVSLARTLGLT